MALNAGMTNVRNGPQLWIAQQPHAACCYRRRRLSTAPLVRCCAAPAQHSRRSALAAVVAAGTATWSQPALASQLRDFLQSRQKIYVMAPIHVTQQRLQVLFWNSPYGCLTHILKRG